MLDLGGVSGEIELLFDTVSLVFLNQIYFSNLGSEERNGTL